MGASHDQTRNPAPFGSERYLAQGPPPPQYSEIPYDRLVEYAGNAFFFHDLGGRYLGVNRKACESLEYTREEILGRWLADVDTKYDAVDFLSKYGGMTLGTPTTVQRVHRRKDGTTFPVEIRASLFAEGERPLYPGHRAGRLRASKA